MPKVTLVCHECGYKARRELSLHDAGHRGIHETTSEPGLCPKGHGLLHRADGLPQERWAKWAWAFNRLPLSSKIVALFDKL